MSENVDLGTLSAGVTLNLEGMRAARQQFVNELAGISSSLKTMATEAENAGKRATAAAQNAASNRALRQAAKSDADALAARNKVLGDFGRTATVAGGAITTALGLAAHAASEFDQAMRNTNSLAHLNETQFKQLKSSVMSLVDDPNIRQGPTDLAKGLYDVYGSGFQGQKALDVLKVAAYGASAGMTDTATSGRVLMAVLNSGVKGADDAKTAMDVLFREVDLGVNDFNQLAGSIGVVLPTAKIMGVSLQEVAAALATMTRQGLSAAEATTSLNNLLNHIANPAKEAGKLMDELGIAHGATALETKGLVGWLDEAIKKTKGNKDQLIALIPELRGMKGELILASDNAKTYKEMLTGMATASDGAGAAQKALAEQNKGAAAQAELAKKNFEKLSIELGDQLLPAINKVLGKSVELMQEFHKLPVETQGAIAKFALGAGGFLTVAGFIAQLIIKIGELKVALATLQIPGWLAGGKVLTAGGLSAGAGYSGVGGFLPGVAGGAMFALPAIGGALGGMAITHQNDIVNQNTINDASLPSFVETAGKRDEVKERLDKRQAKVNEIRSPAHAAELDRLLPLLGGADQRAARVKEDQSVLDAYRADAQEWQRLDKIYNAQRAQFDKSEKANGVKRPPTPPKKVTPKKAGGGSGGSGGEHELTDDEKGKAKQLADSREQAMETFAQQQIDAAMAAFNALLDQYRENGGIKNLARAREIARVVEARQRALAGLRLAHADATDKPAAQADYNVATSTAKDAATGAPLGSIARDQAALQKELDDAKADRAKKAASDAKEAADKKRKADKEAVDADLADDKARQDQSDKIIEGIIHQADEDVKNGNITRTAARERFSELLGWLDQTDAKYEQVTVKIRELNKSLAEHGENEFDLNGPGAPQAEGGDEGGAQNLPGGAVLTQSKDLERELGQPKNPNPFKYIGDSMAQNLDFSLQRWHSFKEGLHSIVSDMKQAFIKAVAEMAAKWATMQIGQSLGMFGGPVGSLVGAGAGSILGGLFGGHRAAGGPMEAGHAYAVAESGTGGELIIPRVPSLAVPLNALMTGKSGGHLSSYKGGNQSVTHVSVQVTTGDIHHGVDVDGLGQMLGWSVANALPTARGED